MSEGPITDRGAAIRPTAQHEEKPTLPRKDHPQDFKPIIIEGLTDDNQLNKEVQTNLSRQGIEYRIIFSQNDRQPLQILFYRKTDIENAKELSAVSDGSPLRMLTPEGIVWSDQLQRYIAMPLVWSEGNTQRVVFSYGQRGEVIVTMEDRPGEEGPPIKNKIVLYGGEAYYIEEWDKANQTTTTSFAEEGLGLPTGSPASKPEPISFFINYDPKQINNADFSSETGFPYSPVPGTRYGFMGWTRPKKI